MPALGFGRFKGGIHDEAEDVGGPEGLRLKSQSDGEKTGWKHVEEVITGRVGLVGGSASGQRIGKQVLDALE